MEQLRELGRTGIIADWVDNPPSLLGSEQVRGVGLDIDDYWLSWWGIVSAARAPLFVPSALPLGRMQRTSWNIQYDFTQRPPDWTSYCGTRGYPAEGHPVRVIVALRDKLQITADYPRNVGPHPIIYEVRAQAVAQVQSGDYLARSGIAANKFGTVGGFLFNSSDQSHFAVTCAHVLQAGGTGHRVVSPRPSIFGLATEVGRVQYNDYPQPTTGKCNNRIGTPVPRIDAATIVIDLGVNVDINGGAGKIGKISAVADLGPGDEVEFHGARSGRVEAKIAQATIWHEIDVEQVKVCFGDLFAIRPRTNIYVNKALSRSGDSASWVVHTQAGTTGTIAWDGMLIAGDGAYSYCCYADSVFQALRQDVASLVLPP